VQSCCAAFALVVCTLTAVPIFPTSANAKPLGAADVPSGKDLFIEHCAQCHGSDGTGNGPMASTLNVKPADLTTLSKRANGKFDAARIADIIRYGGDISGHGTRAMPIWGLVFSNEAHGGKGGAAYSRRAVIELKTYLQSIQKK
jgi:mono/diheme cytochrome c family protein